MIRYIATAAILASAGAAHAQDSRFQPMQLGDAQYTCDQLITEAGTMEEQIGGQPSGAALGGAAVGIGTDLAIRAGGYQAARAIGMFGGALSGAMERKKQAEEERKQLSERRWFYMVGLYQGNGCDQPQAAQEPVMQQTAAQPAPAAVQPVSAPVEAQPEPMPTMAPLPSEGEEAAAGDTPEADPAASQE